MVELFELASRRRSRLFMHTAQLNVVNASINVDRTLLRMWTRGAQRGEGGRWLTGRGWEWWGAPQC